MRKTQPRSPPAHLGDACWNLHPWPRGQSPHQLDRSKSQQVRPKRGDPHMLSSSCCRPKGRSSRKLRQRGRAVSELASAFTAKRQGRGAAGRRGRGSCAAPARRRRWTRSAPLLGRGAGVADGPVLQAAVHEGGGVLEKEGAQDGIQRQRRRRALQYLAHCHPGRRAPGEGCQQAQQGAQIVQAEPRACGASRADSGEAGSARRAEFSAARGSAAARALRGAWGVCFCGQRTRGQAEGGRRVELQVEQVGPQRGEVAEGVCSAGEGATSA
jgi:hypothetical protein